MNTVEFLAVHAEHDSLNRSKGGYIEGPLALGKARLGVGHRVRVVHREPVGGCGRPREGSGRTTRCCWLVRREQGSASRFGSQSRAGKLVGVRDVGMAVVNGEEGGKEKTTAS